MITPVDLTLNRFFTLLFVLTVRIASKLGVRRAAALKRGARKATKAERAQQDEATAMQDLRKNMAATVARPAKRAGGLMIKGELRGGTATKLAKASCADEGGE